jgi:hypothetical protein
MEKEYCSITYKRKIHKFLNEGHKIQLKKMKKLRGEIRFYLLEDNSIDRGSKAHIILDHRQPLLSTFVHEFLHWEHPDWSEEKVLQVEAKLMNTLTERQFTNIMKKLAQNL